MYAQPAPGTTHHSLPPPASPPLTQVQAVFDAHKGEGLWAVVNLIGDFEAKPLAGTSPEDLTALMATNVMPAFNILKVGGGWVGGWCGQAGQVGLFEGRQG